MALYETSSADLGVQVRDARRQFRERQAALADAQATLKVLTKERETVAAEEQAVFNQLCHLRQEANDEIRRAAEVASGDLAEALLALVAIRIEEDKMTLEALAREVASAQEEASKLTAMLRAQRAESTRGLKALAADHRRVTADADRQIAEVTRYRQERQDIIARTESACLKHAQDLFFQTVDFSHV
jgi:uncharacterized coiled-coil DUF342 family protein